MVRVPNLLFRCGRKVSFKKRTHDKKGGIGQAHAALEGQLSTEEEQHAVGKMDSYLDNLTAAATQEKEVLEDLINNNAKLITQLEVLTKKYDQLTIKGDKFGSNSAGYHCTKNYSSATCTRPGHNHCKEATQSDIKGGSTQNKEWVCSHYEEKGFWVSNDRS